MLATIVLVSLSTIAVCGFLIATISWIRTPRLSLCSLAITVYTDTNGNGRYDDRDYVWVDVPVRIQGPDLVDLHFVTDECGNILIRDLGHGPYRVTLENGIVREFNLTGTSHVEHIDLGIWSWSLDDLMAVKREN